MRRRDLFLLPLVVPPLGLPSLGVRAEPVDLRIQLNPALARVHERDPAAARRILDALVATVQGRPSPDGGSSSTRDVPDPRERDRLLSENPLLQEAYRMDPRAALKQLQAILASGGGGK